MTTIKFYGGVNQIGGNKILIEDKKHDAVVFLDFGMNFTERGKYFEEFIKPRTANGIVDLLELGILPNLDGIYRQDLLEMANMKTHENPVVDAVILSHAHMDHASHIAFLDGHIPVYCSEITYAILKAVQESGRPDMENEVVWYKERPIERGRKPLERKFNLVKKSLKINGLEIEMFPVDHSISGACGMVVHGSDKTIVYSGDMRIHGTNGHLTQEFAEKAKLTKPDVMLCEGTRIDETDKRTEAYVKANSDSLVAKTKGLVIADFAYKDLTRFQTFLQIARDNNRKLVISFRDAYFLQELGKIIPNLPKIDDPNILIYKEKKRSGTFSDKDYQGWERQFLDHRSAITAEQIKKEEKQLIMCMGYYDMPDLVDLKPVTSSVYLKSTSEAFNEEQEFDLERLMNWLKHFGIDYQHFHASGHAPGQDIVEIVETVDPKIIIPIHTEKAGMFTKLLEGRKTEMAKSASF